jgi:heterotetrameric sarcosine oxidase gamma subunit
MTDQPERLRDATTTARSFDPRAADDPPARARAVVIGGGIVGAAVAYHLAELGWRDTVVLERGRVGCGTSWHAAGLVTRARGSHLQTEMASYSRDFYAALAARSGIDIGFHENGSLSLAQTRERMTELDYALVMARHHGLPAQRLGPAEIAEAWPPIDVRGLDGGALFAGDATVNPGVAALATAKAAFDLGVRVVEDCPVVGLRRDGARVSGVETARGTVECEVVVIAAGLWSPAVGALAGVRLALHAAEHMWVQTAAVPGAERDLPILRDLDGHIYVRHYRGGFVVGAFEPEGKPRILGSIPADFAYGEFEPDRTHFEPSLAKASLRVPALRGVAIEHFLNAPESFTPDGAFLLGETAEVGGLFVAAGLNSQGIILGPGLGRALAAWIDAGAPTCDAAEVDVRRFAPEQTTASYLFERTRESLGRLYAMHWPYLQPETARGLRRGPLYPSLAAAGACFGETAGWERPNWFAPPGTAPVYRYSYGRQNWFAAVAAEHRAAREAAALFDLSSFAKFRIQGETALAAVQRLFTSDLDRAVVSVTYTCLLNGGGGVEADVTVTRLAPGDFLIVAPTTTQAKLLPWLARRGDPAAVVTDVTSSLGVVALAGPRSREVLAALTGAALDAAAFPYGTARRIEVGRAFALALRISYTGELGFELYAAAESLAALYDDVMAAGAPLGLRPAGYHALDGLRAEKGFRHWGPDMGPADTPFEAGVGFTVALDKDADFSGRAALRADAATPPRRRLVGVKLDDPRPLLYGGESLLSAGAVVGRVTSGAYGHTVGAAVGLALVELPPAQLDEFLDAHGAVTVDVGGTEVPATLSERPFYDPSGERARG